MKVIFMGTPDFAVETVDAIHKAGHEIILVITQPDKARGRSKELVPSPVKAWALSHDVEVFQPNRIREKDNIEYLKQFEADIAVVAAFGQILPEEILNMPRFGCINVHASLLPKYRGAAPIQWAILNGEKTTGVTIMQMGVGLDDGDIISVYETEIGADETGGELFDRLAVLGGQAAVETMTKIEDYCNLNNTNRIEAKPQDDEFATHVSMISKELGRIDFTKDAYEIARYVRGLNPWPSAYTRYQGKMLKIWRAEAITKDPSEITVEVLRVGLSCTRVSNAQAKPGEIIDVDEETIYVACGQNVLAIKELQLEGKKRMSVADFIRGREVKISDMLGE